MSKAAAKAVAEKRKKGSSKARRRAHAELVDIGVNGCRAADVPLDAPRTLRPERLAKGEATYPAERKLHLHGKRCTDARLALLADSPKPASPPPELHSVAQ
jgi:hypothetical protein